MTRAVLDANVLIAAVLSSEGAPAECLRAHAEGRFELVVCPHLLAEVAGVLARERFRAYLSVEHANDYVDTLRREAYEAHDPVDVTPVSADPGDDYLVALAREQDVHVLVSGDAHLTSLALDDLALVSPREFMHRLPR